MDVRGKGKGGMKDDFLVFGLSYWWRVVLFFEMGKIGGGRYGRGS